MNGICERVNAVCGAECFSMVTWDHDLGYIYGNVKNHKRGILLRHIIALIPSPTHAVAKALNCSVTPYIPSRCSFESLSEFLQVLKDRPSGGVIASLNMELMRLSNSFFDGVYRNNHNRKLNIPEECLKKLLQICIKEVPFIDHRGQMYRQCDVVAMGYPLGVLLDNFYIGVVEERVFSELPVPPSTADTSLIPLFKLMLKKTCKL